MRQLLSHWQAARLQKEREQTPADGYNVTTMWLQCEGGGSTDPRPPLLRWLALSILWGRYTRPFVKKIFEKPGEGFICI